MKHKFLALTLMLFLLLALAPPALAQGPDGGRVIFGNNFTLEAEQTVEGDVVVFGGNVTTEKSSTIEGDLAVFGGNVNINGQVEGDIAAIGGNVNLGETAVVEGDIALLGGQANVGDGAVVEGSIVRPFNGGFDTKFSHDFDFPEPPAPPKPPIPWSESSSWSHRFINFFEDLAATVGFLLVMIVVSWLVAAFMPMQMKTVGDTILNAGPVSFGTGLLTILIVLVSFLLVFTICLIFVPILAFLMLLIVGLFGWIVVGQLIGERLLIASGQPYPNFVVSTLVGVVILTIVAKMPILSWIPCIGIIFGLLGGLVTLIVAPTGIGAVVLTRFGTRPYTRRSYSGSGGRPPSSPSPGGYDTDPDHTAEDFSDLDINSASEAELKAKIKAALAEADQPEPAGEEPAPSDEPEDEPESDQPPETGEKPEDEPDQKS
jgi:cytoskeletal protein CcmA (bactofilin family)